MINETILRIRQNQVAYQYLKYHSYWYKILMRDGSKFKDMIDEMKEEYKLTTKDRIESIGEKIHMIRSVLEVFG